MNKARGHPFGDRVLLVCDFHRELMFRAVVALATPTASDAALELEPFEKCSRCVMVDHQPLTSAYGAQECLLILGRPYRLRRLFGSFGCIAIVQEQNVVLLEAFGRQVLRRSLGDVHLEAVSRYKLL